MFVLPKTQSFGEKLAQSLSGGLEKGMEKGEALYQKKQDRESQFVQQALSMLPEGSSLDDQQRAIRQATEINKKLGNASPTKRAEALLGHRIKEQDQESRIKENIDPDRWYKKITDPFTGESSEDRQFKAKKLQKQLDSSDFSKRQKRERLSDKFAPEEIEERVSGPLSKEISQTVNAFPDLKTARTTFTDRRGETSKMPDKYFEETPLTEPQREFFQKHLAEVFQKHPDANILQVRKSFEDRGIGWREFRDAYEQLKEEGLINVDANEDAKYLEEYINKPPLGPLNKILHKMKLIGR